MRPLGMVITQVGTSKGEMRTFNSKIMHIYMHEMKWTKWNEVKWNGASAIQKGCITEALELGVTECHPSVFSSLSLCFLLWSHSFQILSTLNHSAWPGGSSWPQFVTSLLKVSWVVTDSGKLWASQGVRQKAGCEQFRFLESPCMKEPPLNRGVLV